MSRPLSSTKRSAAHIATLRLQRNAEYVQTLAATGASQRELTRGVRALVQSMADCSVPDFGIDTSIAADISTALQGAQMQVLSSGHEMLSGAVVAVQHSFAFAVEAEDSVMDSHIRRTLRAGVRANAMRDMLNTEKSRNLHAEDRQKLLDFDAETPRRMAQLVHVAIYKDASKRDGHDTALTVLQQQAKAYVGDRKEYEPLSAESVGAYWAAEVAATRVATVKATTAKWDIRTVLVLDMQEHGRDVGAAAGVVSHGAAQTEAAFRDLEQARFSYARAQQAVADAHAANGRNPLDPTNQVMQDLDAADQQLQEAARRHDGMVGQLDAASKRFEMLTTRLTRTVTEVAMTVGGDERVARLTAQALERISNTIDPNTAEGAQALGAVVAAQAVTRVVTEGFVSEANTHSNSDARTGQLRDLLDCAIPEMESIGEVAEVLTAALAGDDHRGRKPATRDMAQLIEEYIDRRSRDLAGDPLDGVELSAYQTLVDMMRHAEKAALPRVREELPDGARRAGRGLVKFSRESIDLAKENLQTNFDRRVADAANGRPESHAHAP